MTTYRTVKVPEDLFESILSYIEENTVFGYRSPAEFVIDASRRRLEELKKLKE
ncbi:MAG: hypothetical protein ACFFDF_17130 [Candidatus Odinarchaeota archaeon]